MDFNALAAWYAGNRWFGAIMLFILGLCIGSFLNVCIYRIPQKISIRTPPSHCPDCNARLTPLDMVPVLSWLFLRGKCRHCGNRISPRYLFVELLTGALFLVCWWKAPDIWRLLPALCLTCVLVVSAFIDADYTIIPNGTVLFGAVSGMLLVMLCYVVTGRLPWQSPDAAHPTWTRAVSGMFAGALAGGAPLLAIDMISRMVLRKDGMGGGDVKLMAMAGLYLGATQTFVALILALLAGGFMGAVLLISKTLKRGDYFPFGPFLAIGSFAAILFSSDILKLYGAFNQFIVDLIVG